MRSSVPDLFWKRAGSKHCCFSTRGQDGGGRVSHSLLSFIKPDLPASFHPAVAESMLRHRLSLHPALGFEVLEGAQWACGLAGVPAGGTVFAQFCSWLSSIPFQPLTSARHRRGPKRTRRKSTKRTWRKIHPCRCCCYKCPQGSGQVQGSAHLSSRLVLPQGSSMPDHLHVNSKATLVLSLFLVLLLLQEPSEPLLTEDRWMPRSSLPPAPPPSQPTQ